MRDFLQTPDGDLDLRHQKIIEGVDAVRQRIIQRFAMRQDSFPVDTEAGLNQKLVFGQGDPVQIESWLVNYLADTPGVLKILEADFEAVPEKRELIFSFLVLTDAGEKIKDKINVG